MNLLNQYGSSSEDEKEVSKAIVHKRPKLELAPYVETKVIFSLSHPNRANYYQDYQSYDFVPGETTKEIAFNVPYENLSRVAAGPANPFAQTSSAAKNLASGYYEKQAMSDHVFNDLHRTYLTHGYTIAPDGTGDTFVGDVEKAAANNGLMVSDMKKEANSKKRKPKGDVADVNLFRGPWAGYEGEESFDPNAGPTAEEIAESEQARLDAASAVRSDQPAERTIFHGKEERDYLGRTYMHCPTDIDIDLTKEPGTQTCFIPKKCIHTWSGHTKGVNAIRFLPNTAHLLLSASMDGKVKLWDVYHERNCLRTIIGHTKGVRDICFTNDGSKFLTASYDRMIKLWDTETGISFPFISI